MKVTVTEDDGRIIAELHIPDRETFEQREDRQWQQRVTQAQNFRSDSPAGEHPVRPTDHDVQPTSPPVAQQSTLYGAVRTSDVTRLIEGDTFRWNPAVTEVLPVVVPCPDAGAHFAAWGEERERTCGERGGHTHYADGSVRPHSASGG